MLIWKSILNVFLDILRQENVMIIQRKCIQKAYNILQKLFYTIYDLNVSEK